MIQLNDKTVDILREYLDAYTEAPTDNRAIYADRLAGALDMALATAEETVAKISL